MIKFFKQFIANRKQRKEARIAYQKLMNEIGEDWKKLDKEAMDGYRIDRYANKYTSARRRNFYWAEHRMISAESLITKRSPAERGF